MAKPVVESTTSSDGFGTTMPMTQSLLGGIKRVLDFFVMEDDELSQAGIDLNNSPLSDTEDQILPFDNVIHGRRVK